MIIDPIIFSISIVFTFLLIVALVIVVFAYERLLKKPPGLEIERQRLSQQAHLEALELLDMARARSVEIVGRANETAQNIIDNSKQIDLNNKQNIKQQLQEVFNEQKAVMQKSSEDLTRDWQAELQNLKLEDSKVFRNIATTIEQQAVKEIDDFKQILLQETLSSQKTVEQKLEGAYKNVEQELADYRTQQMRTIDQKVTAEIANIAKTVLGKTIRLDEHEELVIQALEKAKKDNLL